MVAACAMFAVLESVHLAEREDQRRTQREARASGSRNSKMCGQGPRRVCILQHHGFAQRIDGRIGDLRKALAEERVERTRRAGQRRNGGVVAHRPDGVFALGGHGRQDHAHIFAGEAEAMLQAIQFGDAERR